MNVNFPPNCTQFNILLLINGTPSDVLERWNTLDDDTPKGPDIRQRHIFTENLSWKLFLLCKILRYFLLRYTYKMCKLGDFQGVKAECVLSTYSPRGSTCLQVEQYCDRLSVYSTKEGTPPAQSSYWYGTRWNNVVTVLVCTPPLQSSLSFGT